MSPTYSYVLGVHCDRNPNNMAVGKNMDEHFCITGSLSGYNLEQVSQFFGMVVEVSWFGVNSLWIEIFLREYDSLVSCSSCNKVL